MTPLTYQDAVKSRRGSSSLHVPQNGHSRVKTQIFDNKLEGYKRRGHRVPLPLLFLTIVKLC